MDRAAHSVEKVRRLVMFGKTGVGKSASANSILGKPAFCSEFSMSSITRKCEKATANWPGYLLEIIDTPGFLDTTMSQDEVSKEIKRCVKMSLPGPHAFILVLSMAERFTEKELQTIEYFKAKFGKGMLQYLFVLFTHVDGLGRGHNLNKAIADAPDCLKKFLSEIDGRYFGINNKLDLKEKTEQAEYILKAVDKNLSKHGVAYYTSEMLQKAEEEERRQKEEEKRKEQELMEQKMKELIQQKEEEKRKEQELMEQKMKELIQQKDEEKRKEQELMEQKMKELIQQKEEEKRKEQELMEQKIKELMQQKEEEKIKELFKIIVGVGVSVIITNLLTVLIGYLLGGVATGFSSAGAATGFSLADVPNEFSLAGIAEIIIRRTTQLLRGELEMKLYILKKICQINVGQNLGALKIIQEVLPPGTAEFMLKAAELMILK